MACRLAMAVGRAWKTARPRGGWLVVWRRRLAVWREQLISEGGQLVAGRRRCVVWRQPPVVGGKRLVSPENGSSSADDVSSSIESGPSPGRTARRLAMMADRSRMTARRLEGTAPRPWRTARRRRTSMRCPESSAVLSRRRFVLARFRGIAHGRRPVVQGAKPSSPDTGRSLRRGHRALAGAKASSLGAVGEGAEGRKKSGERAPARPPHESWSAQRAARISTTGAMGTSIVSLSVGAEAAVCSGGLAGLRGRPRNGCIPNSVSFSERIP